MKKLIVFGILIPLVMPACASMLTIAEHGWGIPISFGSETKPTTGKIVFVDSVGKVLTPTEGVLAIPDDSGTVTGYIIPDDANEAKQFEMRKGLTAISKWDELNPTEFDSAIGWRFTIKPDEYGKIGDLRTLTLMVKQYNAKHWFARIGFKLTYAHGSVKTSDRLILSVVPAAKAPAGESIASIVDALNKRFDETAKYASTMNDRLTKLEQWAEQVAEASPAKTTSAQESAQALAPMAVEFQFRKLQFTKLHITVRNQAGVTVLNRDVESSSISAMLVPAQYWADIKVPNVGMSRDNPFVIGDGKPVGFDMEVGR